MTLSEIIAGMEHLENLKQIDGDRITGVVKQLVAFRAELEEIAQKWNRREGWTFFGREDEGPLTLDCCANELRAKIGEKR